nr:ATP-binding protein [Ramlibacter paludis]
MFSIIIIAYQRSRRELQENERTLQKIFDTAPAPIVITRPPRGEIERANALAIEALGLAPGDALGRSAIEHGLVADAGARERIYAELAAGRKVTGEVLTVQRAGGEARILAVHADRILLASGERNIFSFYDLTELRRAESDLAHAQRVTALGELSASLAHEVGQPLTAILANAQAARRFRQIDARHPELDQTLVDIAAAARDAGETISRLRLLFRKGATQHATVSLNAVVEDVLRLLKGSLVRNRVEVAADLAADLPAVTGDAIQLRQVLLNLLVNAQEAINAADAQRREIHVSTRRVDAHRIAVTVRDSGPGIAESELERIFDHFVTTKPNGIGMGLAVSRTILEAHDGRIWAERADGAGLTLRIELPAAG